MTPELRADLEKFDASFDAWRVKNGGKSFSQFSASKVAKSISAGRSHSTLGPLLTGEHSWQESGRYFFDYLTEKTPIEENAIVCDYGCGSLRIGSHFIVRQAPGCYIGLDVVEFFIDQGRGILGPQLLEEKMPLLGSIDATLPAAIERTPDLTVSINVACHVHPEEAATYVADLKALTHKPGARLAVHLSTCDRPVRYQRSGWARPLDDYVEMLRPLRLLEARPLVTQRRDVFDIATYMAIFERPNAQELLSMSGACERRP